MIKSAFYLKKERGGGGSREEQRGTKTSLANCKCSCGYLGEMFGLFPYQQKAVVLWQEEFRKADKLNVIVGEINSKEAILKD